MTRMAAIVMARAQRMMRTRSSPRCSVSVMTSSGDLTFGRLSRPRNEGLMTGAGCWTRTRQNQRSRIPAERSVDQLVLGAERRCGIVHRHPVRDGHRVRIGAVGRERRRLGLRHLDNDLVQL